MVPSSPQQNTGQPIVLTADNIQEGGTIYVAEALMTDELLPIYAPNIPPHTAENCQLIWDDEEGAWISYDSGTKQYTLTPIGNSQYQLTCENANYLYVILIAQEVNGVMNWINGSDTPCSTVTPLLEMFNDEGGYYELQSKSATYNAQVQNASLDIANIKVALGNTVVNNPSEFTVEEVEGINVTLIADGNNGIKVHVDTTTITAENSLVEVYYGDYIVLSANLYYDEG